MIYSLHINNFTTDTMENSQRTDLGTFYVCPWAMMGANLRIQNQNDHVLVVGCRW